MEKSPKIVISLILLFSIILNSMCFAANIEGTKYELPALVLSELGVIGDTSRLDKKVMKAEMAKYLTLMNGLELEAESTRNNAIFSDVTSSHWAAGYINVAYENGFLTYKEVANDGTLTKYFYPDESVTYQDAITWCVKSLGYNTNSYISKANELKLLENINCSYSDEAIGGDIIILLWNTLNAPIQGENKTVLEKYFYSDEYLKEEIEEIISEYENNNASELEGQEISFVNNINLYNAVKKALSTRGVLFECDDTKKSIIVKIEDVVELNLENSSISNIEELKYFTALESLELNENLIEDVSSLSLLKNLSVLELKNNKINVNTITGLANIEDLDLDLSGNNITDISAIRNLINLYSLDLSENSITDINPLSNLTNLGSLNLIGNNITDISALSNLTDLNSLHLSKNKISNVAGIANLIDLRYLGLSENQIIDISPLKQLTKLRSLYLDNNKIIDISALAYLTVLNDLYLNDNKIKDITALASLTALDDLYLYNNEISDITALSNLTNLYTLFLSNNQIKDISALSNLKRLTDLDLSINKVEDISPLKNLSIGYRLNLNKNNITDVTPLIYVPTGYLGLKENKISDFTSILSLFKRGAPVYNFNTQTLTDEVDVNEKQIELLQIFKNQTITTKTNGNVKVTVNKENMIVESASAGDKVVLTISKGDFKDSVITYTFTGTPVVVAPTPTPEPTVTPEPTPETPKTKYQITVKASSNGKITPEGTTDVYEGQTITYEIDPNKGYRIKDVLVDGVSVGNEYEYTFTNIMKNHTIEAKFEEVELYTITAKAGINGTITPVGVTELEEGENKTYKIKANTGFTIEDVLVDGKSVGKVSTYKFKDIDKNHTIEAKFTKIEDEDKIKFEDVKENDWFNDSVEYVTEKGLMNGVDSKNFSPNTNATRGMLVTILYRLAKIESNEYSTFDDVPQTAYYSKAIAWASKKGIVNGIGDNKFAPDSEITREQLVTILYRYADTIEKETMGTIKNNLTKFDDANKINTYAMDSFKWAVKQEIITGRTEKELAPQGTAKRAEVATMLRRFIER